MDYDVAIVGAGASGLAAAQRLAGSGLRCIVLEARARIGGRGHTVTPGGGALHLDLGCGWLHSADRNPFTAIAQRQGLTIDRTPAAWGQEQPGFGMGAAERAAFGQAMDAIEEKIEAAARGPRDVAVSALLDPHDPWTPLLNAFSAYYNGAEFDQVSARDYAAYEDDGVNWRVRSGRPNTWASVGRASGSSVIRNSLSARPSGNHAAASALSGNSGRKRRRPWARWSVGTVTMTALASTIPLGVRSRTPGP